MHLKDEMPFKMHKIVFFFQKNKTKKKQTCVPMQTKIWGWETYLEITCDEFVYMSTQ